MTPRKDNIRWKQNSTTFKKGMVPWNKGLIGKTVAWNKGLKNPPTMGHRVPHTEEAKLKCSNAQKKRWESGEYKNRVIDYSVIAEKNRKEQKYKKITEAICLFCGKNFFYQSSRKLKYCSKKCNGLGTREENHWNWGSDKTSERRRKSGRIEYKEWRLFVFKRDNYTCQYCLEKGGYLNAHHIKEWAKYPELRYVKSNGLTLCKKCHLEVHRKKK